MADISILSSAQIPIQMKRNESADFSVFIEDDSHGASAATTGVHSSSETSHEESTSGRSESSDYHWQLVILFAELMLASFLNWIRLPPDLAIACACEITLAVLMFQNRKIQSDETKALYSSAAKICLVCGVASFCWVTVISNRSSAFLPFEFGSMVFLPAISALMQTGFTWFFGERELKSADLDAVKRFYKYHFLAIFFAAFSLGFERNTDKIEAISDEILKLKNNMAGISYDIRTLKNNTAGISYDIRTLKNNTAGISMEIRTLEFHMDMRIEEILAALHTSRPGDYISAFALRA